MKNKLLKIFLTGFISCLLIIVFCSMFFGISQFYDLINDIDDFSNWMGYIGLLCQVIICVLWFMTAIYLGLLWVIIYSKPIRTIKTGKVHSKLIAKMFSKLWNRDKKYMWIPAFITFCAVMFPCCQLGHNVVLDFMQPPVTENVILKGTRIVIGSGRHSRNFKKVIFQRTTGDVFYVNMPLNYQWLQHCGVLYSLDQALPGPRNVQLTYYPNSKTVIKLTVP